MEELQISERYQSYACTISSLSWAEYLLPASRGFGSCRSQIGTYTTWESQSSRLFISSCLQHFCLEIQKLKPVQTASRQKEAASNGGQQWLLDPDEPEHGLKATELRTLTRKSN